VRARLSFQRDVEEHLARGLVDERDAPDRASAGLYRLQTGVARRAIRVERRGAVDAQAVRARRVGALEQLERERRHAEVIRRGARAEREDDLRIGRLDEAELRLGAGLTTARRFARDG